MSYSDFTLRRARQEFNLTIVEQPTFLLPTEPIPPSPFLTTFLDKHLPLALALNTEKARSEMLICPIMLEVKDNLNQQISLFSGNDFTRPLAKVVAEVLWGLNKGERSPFFLRSLGLMHKNI